MRTAWLTALALLACLLASCGGSAPSDVGGGGNNLGKLDYFLSTPAESSVQSEEVDGELVSTDDALEARSTSSLPSGFIPRQGMHFTPIVGPGGGFVGRLDVRISAGSPATDEYEGVLLYLFYIDPTTHTATQVDSSRGRAGNRVTFDLDVLGWFVIAENSAVPRPGDQFTVSAFADQSTAPVGAVINFWAVQQNGTFPVAYDWDFGDGSHGSGESVTHSYAAAGVYNIALHAVDGQSRTAPISSTPITITSSASPLTGVTVTPIQDSIDVLSFSFSATVDGGTAPFSYSWDFDGDGTVDSTDAPPVIYSLPDFGLYQGTLTVTDSLGDTASDDFVLDARQLDLTVTPLEGDAPLRVQVSIEAQGFDAGDLITYDTGDGGTGTWPADDFYTFESPGTFNVVAHGSSNLGGTDYPLDSAVQTVVVNPPSEDSLPFIQLTQPVQPDPTQAFSIYGLRFGASQGSRVIHLGLTELTVKNWTDNKIDLNAPASALSDGLLSIDSPAGNSNSIRINFNEGGAAGNPPAIQNILPRHAAPGSRIFIVGNGLDATDGNVTLGGSACTVESVDDSGIVATLPTSPATGPGTVTVGLQGLSPLTFDILIGSLPAPPPFIDPLSASQFTLDQANWALTLTGSTLGDGLGGLVYSDGKVLGTDSWSASSVGVSYPGQELRGFIVVVRDEYPSNARSFRTVFAPVIESINPIESWFGQQITLTGQHFGALQEDSEVNLNATAANGQTWSMPVVSWSDTSVVVTIPDGSDDGFIVLSRAGLDSNGALLNIIPPPPGGPNGGQI